MFDLALSEQVRRPIQWSNCVYFSHANANLDLYLVKNAAETHIQEL